jgi:tRNA(Glu) U13 pseudouridine synthase TruD
VLEKQGITLDQLRLPGLSRTRFKAARRRALMFPQDLAVGPPVPDELNPGLLRADVSFALGRGSFATIVAKRLVV